MTPTRQSRGGSGNVAESERALAIVQPDQTIVCVNEAYCRMVGRSARDIVGGSVAASGIAEQQRARWVYERLPAPGRGMRYAREMPTQAGSRRCDIEIHSLVMRGEDLVLVEITPALELASAGDAGVLGMVLDRAPGVGVAVYDRDLRIVRVNAMVEQIGRITQAHVGMRITEAVPDVSPVMVGAILQVFETGEAYVNLELSGDADHSYLMTIFPIGTREADVEWVGTIYSDVTERVSAERALAESEQHRRAILASMLQAQEDERSRIATELHDDTVQVMTAALLSMDRLAMVARRRGDGDVESAVARTRATLEQATDRTRRLMFELRPAILHEQGLCAAVGLLADQTAREAGATAHVECVPHRYDHALEELVYRTIREALANVRKHARARRIVVRLGEDGGGTIVGEIHDDGQGFDPTRVRRSPDAALHLGIPSMIERIRAAGGDMAITASPGRGTRLRFSLPVTPGASPAP